MNFLITAAAIVFGALFINDHYDVKLTPKGTNPSTENVIANATSAIKQITAKCEPNNETPVVNKSELKPMAEAWFEDGEVKFASEDALDDILEKESGRPIQLFIRK